MASPTVSDQSIPALVPGLDLLNHSPSVRVAWDFSAENYTITTDARLYPGSEIFNSYGPKSNEEFMISYGFCLLDYPYDWFGLGFTGAVAEHIRTVKQRRTILGQTLNGNESERYVSPTDGQTPNSFKDDTVVCEQHYLRLSQPDPNIPDPTAPYAFSPDFLPHSSIALENARELAGQRIDWAKSLRAFDPESFQPICRNQLHVLASTIILLEKSLSDLQILDKSHPAGDIANERQRLAIRFREGQRELLAPAVTTLRTGLRYILDQSPENGVLKLEYILTYFPNGMLKGYRDAVHTALGTRKANKIRGMGGEECAFTLWICGVWLLHTSHSLNEVTPLSTQVREWLPLLERFYGRPLEQGKADGDDICSTAASYYKALQLTITKHPDTFYRSGISIPLLAWCLNIIREECVQLPNPNVALEAEEVELVLFMEKAEGLVDESAVGCSCSRTF